ncbi:MAG: T9SS type A sorting domain-containing protein [Nonlabens sp.]
MIVKILNWLEITKISKFPFASLMISFCFLPNINVAQNNDFNNGAGDFLWSNAANWSQGTTPSTTQTPRILLTGSQVNTDFRVKTVQNIFATSNDVSIGGGAVLTIDPGTANGYGIQNVSNSDVTLSFAGNITIDNSNGFTLMRNQNGNSVDLNDIEFETGSLLTLTTNLSAETGSGGDTFHYNGSLAGNGNLRFASNTTNIFGSTSANSGYGGDVVFLANSDVIVNTQDNSIFYDGPKLQVNGSGASITVNGANVFVSSNIVVGGTNNFTFNANANQDNLGVIIFSGAGSLDINIDNGVDELSFVDNSGSDWDSGTLNLIGFQDGVVRFGTDSAGLTSAQLSQINVDDGGTTLALDEDGYLYSFDTVWTGGASTDWSAAGNWSNGVPASGEDTFIADVANAPVISSSTQVTLGDLVIEESDGVSINSGGSLIVDGKSSGIINYSRSLGTNNWYLVGSPVEGESLESMIANNSFASGTPPNIGIAPYDNTQSSSSDRYDYQTASSTGALTSGGGYAVKLNAAGDLAFSGTMPVDNVAVAITDATGSGGNSFNLVGNPYPSSLAANTNADATNNLISVNSANLSENTLWFWDQAAGSYDQVNLASPSFYVAPAQGFFVSANGSNSFSFTEAMQSHESDTFMRSSNRTEINLVMSAANELYDTDLFYINGTSLGFDNGYDSSIFGGITNDFAIYTQTVDNSSAKRLGIQSLPNVGYENMIVPVGVLASAGTTLSITANINNLPNGYKVYLEDRLNGTFALLDPSSSYTTTLTSDLNGTGRWFLHTTTATLSSNQAAASDIAVYISNEQNLRIDGVYSNKARLTVYNMLGKRVMDQEFVGSGANNITLASFDSGIYIAHVQTGNSVIAKKLIID